MFFTKVMESIGYVEHTSSRSDSYGDLNKIVNISISISEKSPLHAFRNYFCNVLEEIRACSKNELRIFLFSAVLDIILNWSKTYTYYLLIAHLEGILRK